MNCNGYLRLAGLSGRRCHIDPSNTFGVPLHNYFPVQGTCEGQAELPSVHIELPGLLEYLSKCNRRRFRGFLLSILCDKSRASCKGKDAKKGKIQILKFSNRFHKIFPKTKDTINSVENK